MYESLAQPIVREFMAGTNGCIMAYGQTGAGKTFTMLGDTSTFVNRGVAPRAIGQVFADIDSKPETDFTVHCSYLEIYNERIYDLLLPPGSAPAGDYALVEDSSGAVHVRGLTQQEVASEEEALHALFMGEANRTTAQHLLNQHSNRSHCIFTLHLSQRSRLGAGERTLTSKLYLVDLAGSERLKKTMAARGPIDSASTAADALSRESMHINKSLSYLKQCVVALTSRSRRHVPYRQTRLTNVLKDALGGNCATVLIACIWGEAGQLEETLSTLKLAARMAHVKGHTVANASTDPALLARRYEKQIAELQQELLMHDALSDRGRVVYGEYTPEQQAEVAAQFRAFVDAGSREAEEAALPLQSVRQMREVLQQAKILVKRLESALSDGAASAAAAAALGGSDSAGGRAPSALSAASGGDGEGAMGGAPTLDMQGMVGELSASGGHGVGLALADSRPEVLAASKAVAAARGGGSLLATSPATTPRARGSGGAHAAEGKSGDAEGKWGEGGEGGVQPPSPDLTDRHSAWEWFRSPQGVGYAAAREVEEARTALRSAKAAYRAHAKDVNACKAEIDAAQAGLAQKASQGQGHAPLASAGGEDILDEEEFALRSQLAEAKRGYKAAFGQMTTAKTAMRSAEAELESSREALVRGFESWYSGQGDVGSAQGSPLRLAGSSTLSVSPLPGAGDSLSSTWSSPQRLGRGGRSRTGSRGRSAAYSSRQGQDTSAAVSAAAATAAALLGATGGGGRRGAAGGVRDEKGDLLDDGEAFERMEFERVVGDDPDSVAYFAAQKRLHDTLKGTRVASSRRNAAKRHLA